MNEETKSARNFTYKAEPHDFENPMVLTGTFSFKNRQVGLEILALLEKMIPINGEHYLDQMLELNEDSNRRVGVFYVDSFLSLGTPAEYESAKYWLEAFREWPTHSLYRGSYA